MGENDSAGFGGDTGEAQGTGAGPGDATGGYGVGLGGEGEGNFATLDNVTITGSPAPSLGSMGADAVASGNTSAMGKTSALEDVLNFLQKNKSAQMALGLLSKGHPALAALNAYGNMVNGMQSNPLGSFLGTVASGVGGSMGLGSFGANALGSAVSGNVSTPAGMGVTGSPGNANGANNGGNSVDYSNTLPYLYGMYQQNKTANQLGGLAGNLASLYTQDSPYAQMLRQQLARQDAARGRRSQYGGREVELQAKLAALNSQNAPELARLQTSQMNLRGQQLGNMLALMNTPEGKQFKSNIPQWFNQGKNYLSDMYNQYTAPDYTQDMGTPISYSGYGGGYNDYGMGNYDMNYNVG